MTRRPIPPAFCAQDPRRPVDWYAIRLRLWAAKLVMKAARYREMEFARG